MNKKLTLSQKISRLRTRLRDSEWRRYGVLLLLRKGDCHWPAGFSHGLSESRSSRLPGDGRRSSIERQRHRQSDQYGLDAGRRVSRFRYAGWIYDAGSWFLPFAGNGQRAHGVRGRHLPLRDPVLRVGLCIYVQPWQRLYRQHIGSFCRARPQHMKPRAYHSWQSGFSSLRSPIPAPQLPRAR